MASSGAEKWKKYFGHRDVHTTTRVDTAAYRNGRQVGLLAKGTAITVLAGPYSSMPTVRCRRQILNVKLKDIEKPKQHLAVTKRLCPSLFGLGSLELIYFCDAVKDHISSTREVPSWLAPLLHSLIDHAADLSDHEAVQAVTDQFRRRASQVDRALLQTINNDFMEVLGPLLALNQWHELADGEVIFPAALNEPLFDFEIQVGDRLRFSSKRSGSRTNTLKASDVWTAVQHRRTLQRTHARELELLRLITETPVKQAAGELNSWLARTFRRRYRAAPAPSSPGEALRLEAAAAKWISTQSNLDFLPVIREALPNLWYVKARLNANGTVRAEPLKNAQDIGKTELRSKNSPAHFCDKLGFVI